MRESERRIKQYNKMLIHLREKVSGAVMFLIIAVVMVVSATFAWVTLSRSPEVKGISTTITANGNLEIALSDVDGLEPDESEVGDSNKDLLLRNLTWGNLVNLSDSRYGLEQIVLRPATLNRSDLSGSPLFAAQYSSDGRVESLTSSFAYTNYDSSLGAFLLPEKTQYGVRAVSSVKYTYADGTQAYYERVNAATNALAMARSQYESLVSADGPYMKIVCNIIGAYLTDKFNESTSDFGKYVESMYNMMLDFKACMDAAGEAYLQIANLKLYVENPTRNDYFITLESLMESTDPDITGMEGFAQYKSDYAALEGYLTEIEGHKNAYITNKTPVYWVDLQDTVNFMAHIDSTTVDGIAIKNIGKSVALDFVSQGNVTHSAVITSGALVNMEKRLGAYMYAQRMSVSARYILTITLYADVTTSAYVSADDLINKELKSVTESGNTGGAIPTASDTYGMAIDFWVRSNADEDYLILEGGVITEKVQKTDEAGRLYFTDGSTGAIVLKSGDSYYDVDGNPYEISEDTKLEIVYETIVTGYEGANRVWDDASSANSATQGSGSCYVFYADPQSMGQSLELLNAMRVAFIDEKGQLLATAYFDTENYYAASGRVTVPLALSTTSIIAGTDITGNNIYAITQLFEKKATRITALIYVDGNTLTNQEVLADMDIQGQLNIQFGSSSEMIAAKDDDLFYKEVFVSAEADKTYFEDFNFDGVGTTVTLNVKGVNPQTVTANFIRKINDSQGTRQDAISFSMKSEGVYESQAVFKAPGTYVLRSVYLDGIEYNLNEEVVITIEGFVVNNVGWGQPDNYVKILSADSFYTEKVWVQFAGNSLNPTEVKGIFLNEANQQITVDMKYTSTRWEGTAKFSTSGVYNMRYIIVDGEYYEVASNQIKTVDLSLGMKAQVSISETRFDYDGTPRTLDVYVTLKDNKGNELIALENMSLQYLLQGSALVTNGLHSELTWDEEAGVYIGKFLVNKAGAFSFGYLTLGGSSIYSADAPVVQAIPPFTPEYYGNMTGANTFAAGQNASMKITVEHSEAIADNEGMKAVLVKDGQEIMVGGIKSAHIYSDGEDITRDLTDWSFKIPTDEELVNYGITQEGTWQITKIYIAGAYKDGVLHDSENPMEIDLSSKNIITSVSNKMEVVVTGSDETKEIPFMMSVSAVEGLNVKIQSTSGMPANGVENVMVTYKLNTGAVSTSNGTSNGYYGDASLSTLESYSIITASLVELEQGVFGLSTDYPLTFKYAGTYEIVSVSFDIAGMTYVTYETLDTTLTKVDSNLTAAPEFTVVWTAPEVIFTGVDPSGSITINSEEDDSSSAKQGTGQNTVVSDYEVVANMNANSFGSITTGGGGCSGSSTREAVLSYSLPTVYVKIVSGGNFTGANLSFSTTTSSGGCGGSNNDIWSGGEFVFSGSTTGESSASCVIGAVNAATDNNNKTYYTRERLGSGKAQYITMTGGTANETIQYVFVLENPLTITQEY